MIVRPEVKENSVENAAGLGKTLWENMREGREVGRLVNHTILKDVSRLSLKLYWINWFAKHFHLAILIQNDSL